MKEVKTKIEKLKEEISSIEDNGYKEIFDSILSIVSDISDSIEEIDYKQDSLEENIKYMKILLDYKMNCLKKFQ